jgi:hypothetical protein
MKQVKVIHPSKIRDTDDYIGYEWDAGYVPSDSSPRRCRITVRKVSKKEWLVYAVAGKDTIPFEICGIRITLEGWGIRWFSKWFRKCIVTLGYWEIRWFKCEACAEAFALDLVFGEGYAACAVHNRDGFHKVDIIHGRTAILCCLMNIDRQTYYALPDYAMSRISDVVWRISYSLLYPSNDPSGQPLGPVIWQHVVKAWEFAELHASRLGLSLDSAISTFYDKVIED